MIHTLQCLCFFVFLKLFCHFIKLKIGKLGRGLINLTLIPYLAGWDAAHLTNFNYGWVICLHYLCPLCIFGAHWVQERTSDILEIVRDGCEPPWGCWELNLGSLEYKSLLLTTEPSLALYIFKDLFVVCMSTVHLCVLVCLYAYEEPSQSNKGRWIL